MGCISDIRNPYCFHHRNIYLEITLKMMAVQSTYILNRIHIFHSITIIISKHRTRPKIQWLIAIYWILFHGNFPEKGFLLHFQNAKKVVSFFNSRMLCIKATSYIFWKWIRWLKFILLPTHLCPTTERSLPTKHLFQPLTFPETRVNPGPHIFVMPLH